MSTLEYYISGVEYYLEEIKPDFSHELNPRRRRRQLGQNARSKVKTRLSWI